MRVHIQHEWLQLTIRHLPLCIGDLLTRPPVPSSVRTADGSEWLDLDYLAGRLGAKHGDGIANQCFRSQSMNTVAQPEILARCVTLYKAGVVVRD